MSSAPSTKRKKSSDNETQTNNHSNSHTTESTVAGTEENKTKEAKTETKTDEKRYPKLTNSICHIDIPVLNVERACDFYRSAFSWSFMDWKPEYKLFTAVSPQCIAGGFALEEEKSEKIFSWPIQKKPMLLYLLTLDINSTLNLVHKSGGIVVRPRILIAPGIGSKAMFYDSEGNYLALYSSNCDGIVECKSLEQTVSLKGTPHQIFEKMLDEKLHTAFMGEASKIDRKEGGEFKISKEYITGRTIWIEKDHKIVQSWRAADWPSGHFSTVSFTFTADTKTGGTTVTLKQDDIPVANFDGISAGWHKYYWEKIDK